MNMFTMLLIPIILGPKKYRIYLMIFIRSLVYYTSIFFSRRIKDKLNAIVGKNIDQKVKIDERIRNEFNENPPISERMTNTLCEAMLHRCIPVGFNINGIPVASGNTRIIFNKCYPKLLADAIRKAFEIKNGATVRKRILEHFNFELREKKITNILMGV